MMKRLLLGALVYLLIPPKIHVAFRIGISLLSMFLLPRGREETGNFSIDRFSARQKLAGRLSWQKLVFFVSCLFLSLTTSNLWVHGFILVSMLLFLSWLGLDASGILGYMLVPLSFILLSVFSLLFVFKPGGETVVFSLFGKLFITEASRSASYLVLMRAMAGLSCLYGLSLSSTMGEIFTVLNSFLPDKVMEILFMMYRFIFILVEFLYQMMDAAMARGGRKNFKRSLQSSGLIASSLLFRSMQQTGRSYDALLARGYQGGLPLEYVARKERRGDKLLMTFGTLYLMLLIFLILWR